MGEPHWRIRVAAAAARRRLQKRRGGGSSTSPPSSPLTVWRIRGAAKHGQRRQRRLQRQDGQGVQVWPSSLDYFFLPGRLVPLFAA
jgi:hypothetical protein